MSKLILSISILSLLFCFGFSAQNFSGTYHSNQDGDHIVLNLSVDANGIVTGSMSSGGIQYAISGQKKTDRLTGVMSAMDESFSFTIQFSGNTLLLKISDTEEMQDEYDDSPETITFQKSDSETDSQNSPQSTKSKSGKVIINGKIISNKQITELKQTYQVKPLPGNYWYDSQSGLYGVIGYPAFGFMLPGHEFGKLEKSASNGDTGVFVNGRELPQAEWAVWSQLFGYWIQPGNYWLDEKGNTGYVGNPTPTENLYIAAQRNAYRGSSGNGDNFWSTRFSAGNSDAGNTRGYVSVPGHGPVGYGF